MIFRIPLRRSAMYIRGFQIEDYIFQSGYVPTGSIAGPSEPGSHPSTNFEKISHPNLNHGGPDFVHPITTYPLRYSDLPTILFEAPYCIYGHNVTRWHLNLKKKLGPFCKVLSI